MQKHSYIMRDLNRAKVDQIMDFNVAAGGARPRSVFEFGVFLTAVLVYVGALALST
ncbi:MAG: hypothetical protein KDJ39_09995 [Gammaproteobacteria bacterium]|nr:hypothetical protein [Gammaproteobacteria bacterium]MCP5299712.1 hypothetical protein [Chromatiaceae bacterium]